MIRFIFKLLKFIFTLFISAIILIFLFSLKSKISITDSIAYFKTIGSQIFNINNEENIAIDSNTNLGDSIVNTTFSNSHFYYEQLDDTSKILYTALENNIDNLKKNNFVISFSTTFNNLLNTTTGNYRLNKAFQSAVDAFFYDHPEVFYLDLSNFTLNTKCISIGSLNTYTVEIIPKDNNYLNSSFNSEEEVNFAIKKVQNIKNKISDTVSGYSVYDKIKYVHDMLVNTVDYDTNFNQKNIYNIYGALIDKKVVCEGYAKAFKYIMDDLNIECILVSGVTTNSYGQEESHMWNYVKLNDSWYGVDVTWDDPLINGTNAKNNLRHDYFLKGRNTFYISHNYSGKISNSGMLFSIPSLSSTNYKR